MRKLISLLLSTGLLVGCSSPSDDQTAEVPTVTNAEGPQVEQTTELEVSPDCTKSNVPCMPVEWQSNKFSEYQTYFRNYWKEKFEYGCPPSQEACIYDGTSFMLFGVGQNRPDGINDSLDWFLNRMEMPVVAKSLLENTTSIMGLQSAEWEVEGGYGTITAQWTFHPDPGLVFSAEISSPFFVEFDPSDEQHIDLIIGMLAQGKRG